VLATTKERILNTAERLFAERGYSATSLRAIIAAADVNLASVHYHFDSKESLLEAVILRRAIPANEERLRLLELCEREAGDGPPDATKVIEAFVLPAFLAAKDPSRGGPVYRRLVGRLYAEGDLMPRMTAKHFVPLLARFANALARSLPDLPQVELYWRVHFAMGSVAMALRGTSDWEAFDGGLQEPRDTEMLLRRLVGFLDAGFRAPVVEAPRSAPAPATPASAAPVSATPVSATPVSAAPLPDPPLSDARMSENEPMSVAAGKES
jgi:AcrR family transcriptional regulator